MSTHINVERICSVCNNKSDHIILGSSNTFGSPDLDLRPAQMLRSTMCWWIEECPYCGYVAKNISTHKLVSKSWLTSQDFNEYKKMSFHSTLAIKFYKSYLISKKINDRSAMFYDALHAAWACDDANDVDNAIVCRKLALEVIDELIQFEKEDFELIKADLLRRSKQFDSLINEFSNKQYSNEILNKILVFQLQKAREKDTRCYRVNDVVNE